MTPPEKFEKETMTDVGADYFNRPQRSHRAAPGVKGSQKGSDAHNTITSGGSSRNDADELTSKGSRVGGGGHIAKKSVKHSSQIRSSELDDLKMEIRNRSSHIKKARESHSELSGQMGSGSGGQ